MILTCPACGTRFHLDATAIGAGGRKVRCAKCKHLWFVEAPDDLAREIEPEADAPATGLPVSNSAPVPPREARGGDRSGYVWLGLSALLVIVAGLVVGRHDIVAAYPPAADVYRKLHLPIQLPATLELADVVSERLFEAGVSILVVEGAIVNISDEVQPVPGVRVALLGEQGRELVAETVDSAKGELSAGERTEFEIRLVDPPPEASNFRVSLLEVGG